MRRRSAEIEPECGATTREQHLDDIVALSRLPDRDLLDLVSRGDLDALGVIYDRHIDAAWTVALQLSENAAAAEHAVAAAFQGLWRRPEPGQGASLVARLLSSVTREAGSSRHTTGRESLA